MKSQIIASTGRSLALLLLVLPVAAQADKKSEERESQREAELNSPLADAAEAGHWERVKKLVNQSSVNTTQPDGMSALHWAVFKDHLPTVELLLKSGADVNKETRYQITPLVIACEGNSPEIVEALLESGADVEHKLPGGETPLMLAALAGNSMVINHLIEHKASINATEQRGQTALMWAAAKGNLAAVEVLLTAGADPDLKTKSGFTALLFAARNGHLEVVQRLTQVGVDIEYTLKSKPPGARAPRKGSSALMLAVESGHYELAMWLVEQGADPNDQRSGYTPLHALSWVRKPNRGEGVDGDPPPRGSGNLTDIEFVKAIVSAGADVNLQLKNGKGGRAVLNHKGATPFLLASKTADLPLLKTFLELGADPLRPNVDGCTPLMACAGIGVRAVGEEAGTESEVIETLKFLIANGANVNAVDENLETAMHGAAYRNFPEVVNFLADQGSNPSIWNHKNKSGWTPVMIAQGHRPGSFKPSPETVSALERAIQTYSRSEISQ